MKLKYTLHVPTEQFGFVSCDMEADDPKLVKTQYLAIVEAFKPQPVNSLPEKDFNALLDEYLSKRSITNGQELYDKMSPLQQHIIQAIKRSYQRLKR